MGLLSKDLEIRLGIFLQALRFALRRRSEQLELTGLQLAHNRPVPLCLVPRAQTS